jgi:ATP-binding cassette subfamily C (CFTR/MRP) protein 1
MALHIIFLVLVATTPVLRHSTSLIAGTLVIAGTGAAIGTSFHEHTKSVAPSSFLQIYFLTTILLDVVRVRTLWLIGTLPPAALLSFILGFEVLILSFESVRKTSSLAVKASTEERSGLWERASFFWLFPMLRQGYSNTLSLTCLPTIDSRLDSEALHDQLLDSWRQSKQTNH